MDWQHKNIANRYRAGDRKILLFFIVLLTGSTPMIATVLYLLFLERLIFYV